MPSVSRDPPCLDLQARDSWLHRAERAGARLGLDLWLKRDDRSGLGLSGNKVRKLEYLLGAAEAAGADMVLTCGGIQSNHCRATAVAARMRGLDVGLLLRGVPPLRAGAGGPTGFLGGNLLLDALVGAGLRWVDHAGWQERDAHLAAWAAELEATGRSPYVIPEGGSNALGSLAFVDAAHELVAQAASLDHPGFDDVIVATGSGGTLAGLAAGFGQLRAAGRSAPRLWGVAVCDDRAYFAGRVADIGVGLARDHGIVVPEVGEGWEVLEGHKGRGYALATTDELRRQTAVAREEGVFLDPVYTGKAWLGLEALAAAQRIGPRVCFWHTGGLFGLMGRGTEVVRALGEDLGDFVLPETSDASD